MKKAPATSNAIHLLTTGAEFARVFSVLPGLPLIASLRCVDTLLYRRRAAGADEAANDAADDAADDTANYK
jgi:hypothetical protein